MFFLRRTIKISIKNTLNLVFVHPRAQGNLCVKIGAIPAAIHLGYRHHDAFRKLTVDALIPVLAMSIASASHQFRQ